MDYPIILSSTDQERFVKLKETCGFGDFDFSDVVARITTSKVQISTREVSTSGGEQRTITLYRSTVDALITAVQQFDQAREAGHQEQIKRHQERVQEAKQLAEAIGGVINLVEDHETWGYYRLHIEGEWRHCSMEDDTLTSILARLRGIHADIERYKQK